MANKSLHLVPKLLSFIRGPVKVDDLPETIKNIFGLFDEYLQPSSNTTAQTIADEINKLFRTNCPEASKEIDDDPELFLWRLWTVVLELSMQIPWRHPSQDKLIDVLNALHNDLPNERILEMEGWGVKKLWCDLPILGPTITETWNNGAYIPDNITEVDKKSWQENFQAFNARLTKKSLTRSPNIGLWALAEALEKEEPDSTSPTSEANASKLELSLPIAAEWMLLYGDNFLQLCKDMHQPETGKEWKGERGLSMKRWNFWKERFGAIKELPSIIEGTRGLASEAQDFMAELEGPES